MLFAAEGGIPPFSIFSAISELVVTAVVLYSIINHLRGKPFMWKPLGVVLAFELVVNIVYMAGKAAQADKSTELSTAMKLFFAGHGILSLLMFIALGVTFFISMLNVTSNEKTWFERHRGGAWAMVFFWIVSVTTGEAIFVMRYLL